MKTSSLSSAVSLNQAIEAGHFLRDNPRRKYIVADRYYVKVKDEKDKEYEIRYFF